MARDTNEVQTPKRTRRPATTIEGRENQLIAMAIDEAERLILSGEASSQLLTHFLKEGTVRSQLEKEKLRKEILERSARIEKLESEKRTEELYSDAIAAMRKYSGNTEDELNAHAD